LFKNSDFFTNGFFMPSLRLQRVRELLKREIGEVIRREIPVGEAGLITVNDINVSGDLREATVYIGILGNAEQQKKGLTQLLRQRKHIQGLVGRAVILKYTPQLRFKVDESLEQGNRVLQIIEELEHFSTPNETAPEDH
jgi:ribosome-binding factor A